jgi:hypothetical protein
MIRYIWRFLLRNVFICDLGSTLQYRGLDPEGWWGYIAVDTHFESNCITTRKVRGNSTLISLHTFRQEYDQWEYCYVLRQDVTAVISTSQCQARSPLTGYCITHQDVTVGCQSIPHRHRSGWLTIE